MKQTYIIAVFSLLISASVFAGNNPVTPKPDKLSSFCASREFDHNLLTWIMDLGQSNSHFEVERSTDGNNWRTIAMVLVTNNDAVTKYSYIDENNTEEVIYYRIRQVDTKGQAYYSFVRTVRRNMKASRIV
jgi:hypothetical protein